MKDPKKVVAIVVAALAAIVLVFVGLIAIDEQKNGQPDDGGSSSDVADDEPRGKCAVEECMKLLEPKMTPAEASEIIGFEGEKSETEDKYTWQLTKNTKIVIEYEDNLGTITATMDKDELRDSKFKISVGYELQNLLREGTSYTYKETVEKFGGVEGHLATNSPTFKRYIWVNQDGITFGATFSDSLDGKTSIISIR